MSDDVVPSSAQVDRIIAALDDLKASTDTENLKRDRRIRWSQTAIWCVVGFAALSLIVSLYVAHNAQVARSAASEAITRFNTFQDQRTKARITACVVSNATNDRINAVIDQDVLTLADARTRFDQAATEETRTTGDQFYADRIAGYLANKIVATGRATANGKRDCTPDGVAAYFGDDGNPPNPGSL